jgi:hypothetical protein
MGRAIVAIGGGEIRTRGTAAIDHEIIRLSGVDKLLRAAYREGIVLAGISAAQSAGSIPVIPIRCPFIIHKVGNTSTQKGWDWSKAYIVPTTTA